MADISKIKTPDGTTYDLKDTAGRKEANLEWGGRSLTSSIAPVSMSISAEHSANRIAFLDPAAIDIEYTTNGGSTWTDSGYNDSEKTWLCTGTQFIAIGQSRTGYSASTALTTNHWTRVTLTGQNGTTQYVYTDPKKLLVNMSTALTVDCLIEYKTGASGAEWKTFGTYAVAGWSGWNDIPLILGTFGGGTSQTSNNWYLRFTFKVTSTRTDNYKGYSGIYGLRLFGTNNWGSASSNYGKGPMSSTGHLYSFDANANAVFPAKVTASGGFRGDVTGNADSATNATNLMAYSGNEVTFGANSISAGASSNDTVWINYRDRIGGSISNNATKVVHYYFGNRKGNTNDVVIHAAKFSGDVEGKASNVTGTVAVANGGTGKTTANDAADNLISGLPAWTANPTDDTYFVRQDTGGTSTFGRVKFSTLWNYIKGKFSGSSPITFSNGTIGINTASTSGYGATKLSTATNSTATDLAATPSAVKTAYDLANTANGTANTALSGVNGTLIYDHTYSITNGVATFVPHVYLKGEEVTSQYAASCFSWKYRLDSNVTGTPSYVNLTTDSTTKGCTVTISTLGYGGHVIGTFTPPSE